MPGISAAVYLAGSTTLPARGLGVAHAVKARAG
jgi:hypothetical protein